MASGGVTTTGYNHSWLTVLNKSRLKEPPTITYQSCDCGISWSYSLTIFQWSVQRNSPRSVVFFWCLSMTCPIVSGQVHASLQNDWILYRQIKSQRDYDILHEDMNMLTALGRKGSGMSGGLPSRRMQRNQNIKVQWTNHWKDISWTRRITPLI